MTLMISPSPRAEPKAATPPPGASLRATGRELLLNVGLPLGVYYALRRAGLHEAPALVLSALPPLAVATTGFIRRRQIDTLSVMVIATTVLALLGTVLSGSPFLVLVRSSFVTGTLALVFALSLATRRPMLFFLARDMLCHTPEARQTFEMRWEVPSFRRLMRKLTLVWSVFFALEAAIRLVVAIIWPIPALVASTQILWVILPIFLVRWSLRQGRRRLSQSR